MYHRSQYCIEKSFHRFWIDFLHFGSQISFQLASGLILEAPPGKPPKARRRSFVYASAPESPGHPGVRMFRRSSVHKLTHTGHQYTQSEAMASQMCEEKSHFTASLVSWKTLTLSGPWKTKLMIPSPSTWCFPFELLGLCYDDGDKKCRTLLKRQSHDFTLGFFPIFSCFPCL